MLEKSQCKCEKTFLSSFWKSLSLTLRLQFPSCLPTLDNSDAPTILNYKTQQNLI